MGTIFSWSCSGDSLIPNCSSSYNVPGKTEQSEMMGDRSMVTEEKGRGETAKLQQPGWGHIQGKEDDFRQSSRKGGMGGGTALS